MDRHTVSIAKEIRSELKKKGEVPVHIEGLDDGDWIVLDYGDYMIHLFTPSLRSTYQLERLWPEGSIIDLDIKHSDEKIS